GKSIHPNLSTGKGEVQFPQSPGEFSDLVGQFRDVGIQSGLVGIKNCPGNQLYIYVLVKADFLESDGCRESIFRIGASELLDDLVRTLEKLQFGKESSSYLHDAREMQHHRPTFSNV
ncbi:deoxyribose-phosphate aldolase, partial [Trichinella spiralis]|uniref:deoxyribose-phosphate aldolase n=1 Tax=Trichinella spiralis TaxID=6334 RepID=UPI0001EFEDEC